MDITSKHHTKGAYEKDPINYAKEASKKHYLSVCEDTLKEAGPNTLHQTMFMLITN